ncbi:MAG: SAM-dependent chlorinase/fluorinase [Acidobacteriota bacterium]
MSPITLLTDFGLRDYYVAAMKGVLLSRAPGATLVDISHDVEPGDIQSAAFLLEAAYPCFPAGTVHLAVVDPGVGTGRHMLALEMPDGSRLVAPDNGLLDGFIDGARRVVAADRPDLYREAPGATFHGRDRFAPLAAALASGARVHTLGPVLEAPVRLGREKPKKGNGLLQGQVTQIDRYGNIVTDIPASWLVNNLISAIYAECGEAVIETLVTCYEEIPSGKEALLVGSLGTLELSRNGESMAAACGVRRGDSVRIRFHSPVHDSKSTKHRAASRREPYETVGVQDHQHSE